MNRNNWMKVYKLLCAFMVGALVAKKVFLDPEIERARSSVVLRGSIAERPHDVNRPRHTPVQPVSNSSDQKLDLAALIEADDEVLEAANDSHTLKDDGNVITKDFKAEGVRSKPSHIKNTIHVHGDNNQSLYSMRYKMPGEDTEGQAFQVDHSMLKDMKLPPSKFTTLTEENLKDFVFGVAATDATFNRSQATVTSIQKFFPNYRIVLVDLGLSENNLQKVLTWCNVMYQLFMFERYPQHVRDMRNYAWRPLVIQDILHYFPAVFWVDVPFTVNMSHLDTILQRAMASGGFFSLKPSGHSVYAATHPDLYKYLPADQHRLKALRMWASTSALLYNTQELYSGVLYWWYLCALDPGCVTPPNITSPCPLVVNNPNIDQFSTYFSYCHRHDQSALNVLVALHYRYQVSRYTMYKPELFIQLDLDNTKQYSHTPSVCSH